MTNTKIPVTAIVLTYNEAANMAPCLGAMEAIDDIVIVDSGSEDDTISEAKRIRPDVRVFSNPFKDFGDQRNWALDNCAPRNEWIVFVDADEYCTRGFLEELQQFVAKPSNVVGAYVAGKNYFLGRWLKHSTVYPSYQLRILKWHKVRFRRDGHGQAAVTDGELVRFRFGWIHNTFSKGVAEWISRHNRYSTTDLDLIRELRREPMNWRAVFLGRGKEHRRALKQLSTRVPLRPLFSFVYFYFVRGGFLDGRPGLLYCLLVTAHHIHIHAKSAELECRVPALDLIGDR